MKTHILVLMILVGISSMSKTSTAATHTLPKKVTVSAQAGVLDVSTLKMLVQQKAEGAIMRDVTADSDAASKLTVCAEVVEVPGTFLCIPMYQQQMNEMLTRFGIYWGAGNGFPAGTLVSNNNPTLRKLNKIIAGHNLPGNVILDFIRATDLAKAPLKRNELEEEFVKGFVASPQVAARKGRFYMIGVSVQSTKDFKETISHEIHHARYYLQSPLKNAIDAFWKSDVTEADKVAIRKILGTTYNSQNESVMIDEFQAYLLEDGAEKGMLSQFVKPYKEKLLERLESEVDYSSIEIK